MSKINIGKIVTTHGVRGEVKVYPHTNVENMFGTLKEIIIDSEKYKILSVKYAKNCPVLKLENITTMEMAEKLIGKGVFADESKLPKLEENTFYIKDIVGLDAVEESGEKIGKVTDVIFTGANDVYEITTPEDKKILLPAVKEFVLKVDIKQKKMIIKLIEGM